MKIRFTPIASRAFAEAPRPIRAYLVHGKRTIRDDTYLILDIIPHPK
jgi:hypothetical protein